AHVRHVRSEELDGASRRRDALQVASLLEAYVSCAEHRELAHAHPARRGEHQHSACLLSAEILGFDGQTLGLDEAAHELDVARADVRELRKNSAASEQLHA